MTPKPSLLGLPLSQAIGLITLLTTLTSIWVHMEIRLAEVNVEITTVKEDLLRHKDENRNDFESLRTDVKSDTREIIRKIDEIQIYLRNHHP